MFRIYGIDPTPDGFVDYSVWDRTVLPEDLREQEEALQKTVRQLGRSVPRFGIRRFHECRRIQAVETVLLNARGQAEWVVGTNLDITPSASGRRRPCDNKRGTRTFQQSDRGPRAGRW